MASIVLASVFPIAIVGAFLIWKDYQRLENAGTLRSSATASSIGLLLKEETAYASHMLDALGQVQGLDSLRHQLQLAEVASGSQYCLLAILNGANPGTPLASVTADGDGCPLALGNVTPGMSPASLWVSHGLPYLRVVREIKGAQPRYLVAVLPVRWGEGLMTDEQRHAAGGKRLDETALSAWIMSDEGEIASLCPACSRAAPPHELAAHLARRSAEEGRLVVSERRGSQQP